MILYVVDASAASAGDTVAVAVAFYWKDSIHAGRVRILCYLPRMDLQSLRTGSRRRGQRCQGKPSRDDEDVLGFAS